MATEISKTAITLPGYSIYIYQISIRMDRCCLYWIWLVKDGSFIKYRQPVCLGIFETYLSNYNISGTLVDNKIVDHSDVVGIWLVGAAQIKSSFSA